MLYSICKEKKQLFVVLRKFQVCKSLKQLDANPKSAHICGKSVNLTNYLSPQISVFVDLQFAELICRLPTFADNNLPLFMVHMSVIHNTVMMIIIYKKSQKIKVVCPEQRIKLFIIIYSPGLIKIRVKLLMRSLM